MQFGGRGDEVHGITTVEDQAAWRPKVVWLGLATFIVVASLGTNLAEIVYVYFLHDPRAILGRAPIDCLFDDSARMLMYVVGLVILSRAGKRQSCFLLGLGIVALTPFPLFQPVVNQIFLFLIGPLAYLLPAFAMAKLHETGIRPSMAAKVIFGLGLGATILLWSRGSFFPSLPLPALISDAIARGSDTLYLLPALLTMALLSFGWKRASIQEGHRYLILILAVGVIILGNQLFTIFGNGTNIFPSWVTNTSSLFRTAGTFLFAYAILKHRVIDIGFAINRTLVYGAVTFTILVAFGLAEYATKGLMPHEGAEAGSIITATIAILLFLSFHHLHQWFEHQIERSFFRSWHLAEAELRRFVGCAGQFATQSALCASFVDELRRFGQGVEVALFLRLDGAEFCLTAGSLGGACECYAEEDRAFALMQGEREPIDLSRAHSTLPGELAAPMLDQQGLMGFVLIGPKSDGSHFRPDEEQNIGWATHQIGLDLKALRAKALYEEMASLRNRVTATEAERDRLFASLALDRVTRRASPRGLQPVP